MMSTNAPCTHSACDECGPVFTFEAGQDVVSTLKAAIRNWQPRADELRFILDEDTNDEGSVHVHEYDMSFDLSGSGEFTMPNGTIRPSQWKATIGLGTNEVRLDFSSEIGSDGWTRINQLRSANQAVGSVGLGPGSHRIRLSESTLGDFKENLIDRLTRDLRSQFAATKRSFALDPRFQPNQSILSYSAQIPVRIEGVEILTQEEVEGYLEVSVWAGWPEDN